MLLPILAICLGKIQLAIAIGNNLNTCGRADISILTIQLNFFGVWL